MFDMLFAGFVLLVIVGFWGGCYAFLESEVAYNRGKAAMLSVFLTACAPIVIVAAILFFCVEGWIYIGKQLHTLVKNKTGGFNGW